jgi:ABC-type amino acid transport substrate-binding protein
LWVGLCVFQIAGGSRLQAADLEDIIVSKVIRVGMIAGDAPPFVLATPGGTPGGLEGEFIVEVARRLDARIEFVRTARNPDELIAQVFNSTIDVGIGQLTDSLEWAKSVRFSKPYLALREVRLVERLYATRVGGTAQLLADKNARVSAAAGSIVLPAIREEFGERLVIAPNLQAAINEVLAGKTVAAVGDDISIVRWLDANPATGLKLELTTRKDRRPGLAMAVNWKSDDLQAWLNLCVDKCTQDGTLQALIVKHLGEARARVNK